MIKKTSLFGLTLLPTVIGLFIIIFIPQSNVISAEQPNIIFIIVDTLRSDHISSYGYARPTTPNWMPG